MYDEPTAGLDPVASTVVEDLIRSLQSRRDAGPMTEGISSYIVVTHQHSTIRRAVDRLVFLHEVINLTSPGLRHLCRPMSVGLCICRTPRAYKYMLSVRHLYQLHCQSLQTCAEDLFAIHMIIILLYRNNSPSPAAHAAALQPLARCQSLSACTHM